MPQEAFSRAEVPAVNLNKLLPRLSIRAKLVVAFVFLTILPLAVVATLALLGWAKHLRDTTRTAVEHDLEIAGMRVENSLREVDQHLGYLVEEFLDGAALSADSTGRLQDMFARFLSTDSTSIFRVKAIDAQGTLRFQSVRSGWGVPDGGDESQGEVYYLVMAEAAGTGENLVLPVELRDSGGAEEKIPAIAVLRPIWGADGELRGVVVAEAAAAALFAGIERAAPGLAGTTGIVTPEGFFLYHSERKNDWANLLANRASIDLSFDYPPEIVRRMLSGRSGTVTSADDRILAFRPISPHGVVRGNGLILYRSVPLDALHDTGRLFLKRIALAGTGILLLVLVAAVVAAEQFTRPIYELRRLARALAEGGEGERLEIGTNDELEDLADDFAVMAEALSRHRHELEEMVDERTRELDAARAELQEVVTHAADAIIGLDPDGRVRLWNRGARGLFGFEAEEAVGRRVGELIAPRDPEFGRESEAIARALSDGSAVVDLRTFRTTREGVAIPVRLTQAPILGENGEMIGSSLVIRDDRLRSRLEEQLRRSERLNAMSVMAAGLAHEINNPLAILSNRVELMRREIAPAAGERLQRHLHVLGKHVDRLRGLTSDLLHFASGDENDMSSSLGLAEVAERVARLLEHAFVSRAVTLEVTVGDAVPPIVGNVGAIETVIANLLLNALQATPAGGQVRVTVARASAGRFVELEVQDSGPGVSPEIQGRIFEPFFTTKGEAGGTGLGLAVCRAVVERHGGRLWLDGGGAPGCRFVARFPAEGRGS